MSKNSIIPFLKDYLINFLTSPFLLDTNGPKYKNHDTHHFLKKIVTELFVRLNEKQYFCARLFRTGSDKELSK